MRYLHIILVACGLALAACGHRGNSNTDGDANGNGDGALNSDATADALTPPNCVPGTTQCTDCKDNDGDGRADGFDPECTGALDNDEGSFATGINGDNKDATWQDCFFDGNSGGGQDCRFHVCCLTSPGNVDGCTINKNSYKPNECTITQTCRDSCLPLVPAGCDCFGCCTVCDPATNECRDIITNPVTSPGCGDTNITDPNACLSCVKATTCSNPCDPANCILCPGQDPSDLPASCGGTNTCAAGQQSCINAACPADTYCANGCCIPDQPQL